MRTLFRSFRRRQPVVVRVRPTAAEITRAAKGHTPDSRARELLWLHLTEDQRLTLRRCNYIEVIGSLGGRYCLHAEPVVYRLDGRGNHTAGYCAHVVQPFDYYEYVPGPRGGRHYARYRGEVIPRDDQVLTFLLLLQNDEQRFLDVARPMPMSFSDQLRHGRHRVGA